MERLDLAKQTLKKAEKLDSKCPCWSDVMQEVALGQNWSIKDYDDLFRKAIALEPDYVSYYKEMARYLLPRWNGSEGDWQAFAAKEADRIGGEAGDILYARIGWYIHSQCVYGEFILEANYSWPRLKKGMEAIIKKYPDSITAASELAYLAYQKKDKDCARPLFKRLGNTVDSEIWDYHEERYLRARIWSQSP